VVAPAEPPAVVNVPVGNGIVPDLTGLNAPQAAALLNRSGLLLGQQTTTPWTPTSPAAGLIGSQSISAGQQVAPGTAVDIAMLQAPNALLIYDDNDITLVNQTEEEMFLTGVRFSSIDGATPATYAATDRWTDSLRPRRCGQLWTVIRNGPKALPECRTIHAWYSSTDPTTHFWTGSNGATKFNVTVGDQEVAVCEIAALRCEFYLPTEGAAATSVPYLYMAYTPDRFIIQNNTSDQWMSLEGVILYSLLTSPEGVPLSMSDPAV